MSKVEILTGPPRSGKTRFILEKTLPFIRQNRCSEILILVPSTPKGDELRKELLSREEIAGFMGLKILNFIDFTHLCFHESPLPGRVSTPVVRRWMIQTILATLDLSHFQGVRGTRGLIDLCADFIRTLKEAGVGHDEFQTMARSQGMSPKLSEIADVYQAYEIRMEKRNLLDREDLFALAAHQLRAGRAGPFPGLGSALVTGFYDFTPIQLRLLSALAEVPSLENLCITLTHPAAEAPAEPCTQRTLQRLRRFFPAAEVRPHIPSNPEDPSPIHHLCRRFFSGPREETPLSCAGTIRVIHTPGAYREVETIARRIRRLILDHGYHFHDFAAVFRGLTDYQDKIREVFRFYDIPHRMSQGLPLRSNPMIQAAMTILEALQTGYQRDAVIRMLRSEYVDFPGIANSGMTPERIDVLSREAMIHGGRQEWKERFSQQIRNLRSRASRLEQGDLPSEELERREQKIAEIRRRIEDDEACIGIMEELFSTLDTLPARGPLKTFVETLDQLLRIFQMEKRIYDLKDFRLIRRDQVALQQFLDLLNQMVLDQETVFPNRVISVSEFVHLLKFTLLDATYSPDPNREDAVLVADALTMRELHRPVVFIGGLVEESFPRNHAPNPVFGDKDRAELNARLGPDRWVPLASHWREEEDLLFLLSAASATELLFLTYPRTDSQGRDLLPSRYVDRVLSLYEKGSVEETRIPSRDPFPNPEEIFRKKELLEYTVRGLHRPAREEPLAPLLFGELLHEEPGRVHALQHGLRVLCARANQDPAYSGELGIPASDLIREQEGTFSVTGLEQYGTCPFQYFLERELRIQPVEEVEDEIGAMDIGSLYHRILEQFYRELGGAVTLDNLDEAKVLVHAMVEQELSKAEFKGVPGHQKIWEIRKQEIHDVLDRFLGMEAEEYEKSGEVPSHFEISFGMEPLPASDPASVRYPFMLASDSGPIRLKGKIDRIDLSRVQAKALFSVIDYKTGKGAPGPTEIRKGESLQLPVYADWVKTTLFCELEINKGCFCLLRSGQRKCQIQDSSWSELRELCHGYIRHYVESIRQGHFPLSSKKCPDYCRYGSVCRKNEK